MINHDRLIGQPVCAAAMLESAVHGRAAVDQELWQELEGVQTWVVEAADQIAAAFSIGRMATDSTIELLWLHAREDQELIEVCLRKVMKVAPKAVRAFSL